MDRAALVLDRRTVSKYLSMSEQDYDRFWVQQSNRKKILFPYEDFAKERLEQFRDTSAAQVHDWLKERYCDLPSATGWKTGKLFLSKKSSGISLQKLCSLVAINSRVSLGLRLSAAVLRIGVIISK